MKNMAFSLQMNEHKSALENFAFSFTKNINDADDLVQDTYLKAIRYANLYTEGTNLRAWLYTIMRNTFINDYRSTIRHRKVVETHEDLLSLHLVKSASSNKAESSLIAEDINKALKNLPAVYRTPFIKYFEGFKYHEIADELNIPIGTVKTRIFNARKLLKSTLKMYN